MLRLLAALALLAAPVSAKPELAADPSLQKMADLLEILVLQADSHRQYMIALEEWEVNGIGVAIVSGAAFVGGLALAASETETCDTGRFGVRSCYTEKSSEREAAGGLLMIGAAAVTLWHWTKKPEYKDFQRERGRINKLFPAPEVSVIDGRFMGMQYRF